MTDSRVRPCPSCGVQEPDLIKWDDLGSSMEVFDEDGAAIQTVQTMLAWHCRKCLEYGLIDHLEVLWWPCPDCHEPDPEKIHWDGWRRVLIHHPRDSGMAEQLRRQEKVSMRWHCDTCQRDGRKVIA